MSKVHYQIKEALQEAEDRLVMKICKYRSIAYAESCNEEQLQNLVSAIKIINETADKFESLVRKETLENVS